MTAPTILKPSAPTLLAGATLLATAGCNAILGFDSGEGVTTQPAGGSAGQPGGTGGNGATGASGGQGGGGGLPPISQSCGNTSECPTSYECVDGWCCNEPCLSTCFVCNAPGSEGQCTTAAAATDPRDDCGSGVCDGAGACARGDHLWSLSYGDETGDTYAFGVAATPSGHVLVAGSLRDLATIGDCELVSQGGSDVLAVRLTADGECDWARSFGDEGTERAEALAADPSGGAIVGGWFTGQIDFGGAALSGFDTTPFVARLDADGQHVYSSGSGSISSVGMGEAQRVYAVAADSSGNAYAGGHFWGDVEIGGGMLQNANNYDGFIVKLDPTGSAQWIKSLTGPTEQRVSSVAVDGAGNVLITGFHETSLDYEGYVLAGGGNQDLFVLKLDPNGNLLWGHGYGDSALQRGYDIAVDDVGNVWVAGAQAGTVDYGCGELTSAGGTDMLLVKLDPNGNCLLSRLAGDGNTPQIIFGVDVDGSGNVVLAGTFTGTVMLGNETHQAGANSDIVVAKFTSDGTYLWSKSFGDGEPDTVRRVAVDGEGNILIAGDFLGTLFFGGQTLSSGSTRDAFVAKLSP